MYHKPLDAGIKMSFGTDRIFKLFLMLYASMINEYLLVVNDKRDKKFEVNFYVPEAFDYLSGITTKNQSDIDIAQILNNAQKIQYEHIGDCDITSEQLDQTSAEIENLVDYFSGNEPQLYAFSLKNNSRLCAE